MSAASVAALLQHEKRSFRVSECLCFFNDGNLFDFSLVNEQCNESKSRQLTRPQDTSTQKIKKSEKKSSAILFFFFHIEISSFFADSCFQLARFGFIQPNYASVCFSLICSAATIFMVHNNRIKNHFREKKIKIKIVSDFIFFCGNRPSQPCCDLRQQITRKGNEN